MSRGFFGQRAEVLHEGINNVFKLREGDDPNMGLAYLSAMQALHDAPLDNDELAAAKAQGCLRCDWHKPHRSECHYNSPRRGSGDWDRPWPVVSERDWCSEWRGSPEGEVKP